jgi:prepilin-type N-terminal cleavage/methylation domain-containing protein
MMRAPAFKSANGFTLVELAISLMIIGLLIAGVLKGMELIKNARVTQIVRQVKSYDTAVTTFVATYGELPGDIENAATRLPNCTTSPCKDIDALSGNGQLEPRTSATLQLRDAGGVAGELANGAPEHSNFWLHLAVANLITGINTSYAAGAPFVDWGVQLPATPVNGAGFVVWSGDVGMPSYQGNMYGLISNSMTTGALATPQAAQLDAKMDDGMPFTGDVFSIGNGASSNGHCYNAWDPTAIYMESDTSGSCDLVFVMHDH